MTIIAPDDEEVEADDAQDEFASELFLLHGIWGIAACGRCRKAQSGPSLYMPLVREHNLVHDVIKHTVCTAAASQRKLERKRTQAHAQPV